jgi:hypothetical protein
MSWNKLEVTKWDIARMKAHYKRLQNYVARIDRWMRFIEYRRDGKTFKEIAAIEGISTYRASDIGRVAIRVAQRRIERTNGQTP